MNTQDLGKLGLCYRGEWSDGQMFEANDLAHHEAALWLCRKTDPGKPHIANSLWQILASCPHQPHDLFVSREGNDAAKGSSWETALASIQEAVDRSRNFSRLGQTVTIHVGDGTFTGNVNVDFLQHYPRLAIIGSGSTRITGGITARHDGELQLSMVTVEQAPDGPVRAIYVLFYSRVTLNHVNIELQRAKSYGLECNSSYINFSGDFRVSSRTRINSVLLFRNGYCWCQADTNMDFNCDYTYGIRVDYGSTVELNKTSFSGQSTGKRYAVSHGGILTNNPDPNAIPGSEDGVIGNFGYYDIS